MVRVVAKAAAAELPHSESREFYGSSPKTTTLFGVPT
jgi:hypothetical protein